jgi:hypothetical protein
VILVAVVSSTQAVMTKRFCNVASAISLVVCVATGWLWVKSYRAGVAGRGRLILNFGNQMWMVQCDSGHVAVLRSPDLVKATQDDLQVCANARSVRNEDLEWSGLTGIADDGTKNIIRWDPFRRCTLTQGSELLNNQLMITFLESQIGLLEKECGSPAPPDRDQVQLVEDLIAFHLTALGRLETHLGAGGLSERDRPLVPLFQRWLNAARKVKDRARDL